MFTLIGVILAIALALALIMVQAMAVLIAGWVISVIITISSYKKYQATQQMVPSKMICRNCNSTNVRIHTRDEGWTMGASGYANYGFASGQASKSINRQHIAVCADCGFDSPYITADDIAVIRESARRSSNRSLTITIILSVLLLVGGIAIKADAEGANASASSNTQITEVQD